MVWPALSNPALTDNKSTTLHFRGVLFTSFHFAENGVCFVPPATQTHCLSVLFLGLIWSFLLFHLYMAFLGGFLFGMVLDSILEGVILELAIWVSGITFSKLITDSSWYLSIL